MTKKILYPPIETDSDNHLDSNMSLSYDLRRSFETVSEIHIAQKRLKTTHDRNTDHDVYDDDKSAGDKDTLQKRKCEAAIDAAVAVESAIAALSNGIAELEDLLSQEDEVETQQQVSTDGFKTSTRITSSDKMERGNT